MEIPPEVQEKLLPSPKLSITELLRFRLPTVPLPKVASKPSLFSIVASAIDARSCRVLQGLAIPDTGDLEACIQLLPDAMKEGNQSFEYHDGTTALKLPFWVFTYWQFAHRIGEAKAAWARAHSSLDRELAHNILPVLDTIPWNYQLPCEWGDSLDTWARFCTTEWMSSSNIDTIAAVITSKLTSEKKFCSSSYEVKLLQQYRYYQDEYHTMLKPTFLHRLGGGLSSGLGGTKELGFCIPVWIGAGMECVLPDENRDNGPKIGNHWVGVVIDIPQKCIRYGDSMEYEAPKELISAIQWWLQEHLPAPFEPFSLENLTCARQARDDNFSCAILAANAIAHYMYPEEFPLISSCCRDDALAARFSYLYNAAKLMNTNYPDFIPSRSNNEQYLPLAALAKGELVWETSKFEPRDTKRPFSDVANSEKELPKKKVKGEPQSFVKKVSKAASAAPAAALFRPPVFKGNGQDDDSSDDEGSTQARDGPKGSNRFRHRADELEDVVKDPTDPKLGGAKPKDILQKLTQLCRVKAPPGGKAGPLKYRCVARSCGWTWAKSQQSRVLKHAISCQMLLNEEPQLRALALDYAAEESPSSKLMIEETGGSENTGTATTKVQIRDAVQLFELFKDAGMKTRQKAADLAFTQLFSVAGLPPYLLEYPEFGAGLRLLCTSYKPPTRSDMEDKMVPQESAKVRQETIKILRQQDNLTISYDGGTAKNHESFWTLHISTEDKKVYLVEGIEATSDSHTAEWILNFVLKVIDEIGVERFIAVVCDSTGNTRLSRRLLTSSRVELSLLFDLPDICHHLSNTIKDVVQLEYFKPTISTLRSVIRKFHTSHPAKAALDRAQFEIKLDQLIRVSYPGLKALTCLEANEATPADVCVYWHAFLRETNDEIAVLRKPTSGSSLPLEIAYKLKTILNRRNKELFIEGGRLSTAAELYYAATYLDPAYLRLESDLFKRDPVDPKKAATSAFDYQDVRHPKVLQRVATFLRDVAAKEIEYGHKPVFTRWKDQATTFKTNFVTELERYARQQPPYDRPIERTQPIALWWNSLQGTKHATILPALARKLFAVRVNSMAEERTVATFTWLTPDLRKNMRVDTMVNMTRIRQFYRSEAKARSKSLPVPRMLYTNAKQTMKVKSADPKYPKDDADDEWLDEKSEGDVQLTELDTELDAVEKSLIDIKHCQLLTGILSSDHKVAQDTFKCSNNVTEPVKPDVNRKDNNFVFDI